MSKQVYISADYAEYDGDRDVVEELNKWGSDNLHKVDFIDMSKVASGSVSKDPDCRICDLKQEFNRQINASSAVIFVVGDKTALRTAGSACKRSGNDQGSCNCTPYKQNTNGTKPCMYDAPHCIFNYHGNDHVIEYNKIHDAVKECLDMDAIYTRNEYVPQWRGSVIKNNYIYNIGIYPVGEYKKQLNVSAIRTDNYGHALQIYNNVFANIGSDGANNVIGVTAQGNRNTLKGNIFVDCSATFLGWNSYAPGATWDMTKTEEKERVELAEKYAANPIFAAKYPELATFKDEYYKSVATNIFDENLVVNIKFKLSQANGTVNPQGTRGAPELIKGTNNYLTTSDPGFVDYANGNYELKSDSEVFKKIPEFQNIDMSKMGNNEPVGPSN